MPLSPPYTQRLMRLQGVTGFEQSDPVPDGAQWVVRCITAVSLGAITLHVTIGSGGVKVAAAALGDLPAQNALLWTGHWVLYSGERIEVVTSSPPLFDYAVDYHASGYVLAAE